MEDEAAQNKLSRSGSFIYLVPIAKILGGETQRAFPYFEQNLICWISKNPRVSKASNNRFNVLDTNRHLSLKFLLYKAL